MPVSQQTDDPGVLQLSDFEGERVTESRIEIPGAAGGLQESLAFDPIELHRGDEVYVLMHLECVKVRHEPVDPKAENSDLRRVHILKPVGKDSAMFMEATDVEAQLKAKQEALAKKRKEAVGVFELGDGDDDEGDDEDEDGDDGEGFYDPANEQADGDGSGSEPEGEGATVTPMNGGKRKSQAK